jgi:hypothetical protein
MTEETPEQRKAFAGTLYGEIEKHKRKERNWKSIYYGLVAGSIVGNIVGTVGVLSSGLDNHRMVLGVLVALPTIAFAVDKGLFVTAFARWHQRAGDVYGDLYDDFYFQNLPLIEGLKLKRAVDKDLRKEQPGLLPLGGASHERDRTTP